ncbi:hypothetical protein Ahu01nite_051470 [Winogradskya humida]|uniref:CHAT domain-containing protein n=1 Tax=Winogradskya humida TaxID=113566 RepID=A0ABQ3ZTW0_9ACTN|nr:hypothetical protein Ahu01nite_051470 [Actinoplanes humidus]
MTPVRLGRMRDPDPDTDVHPVFVTRDGEVLDLGRRPSCLTLLTKRCLARHDVYTGTAERELLPFAPLRVTFFVHDPVALVRTLPGDLVVFLGEHLASSSSASAAQSLIGRQFTEGITILDVVTLTPELDDGDLLGEPEPPPWGPRPRNWGDPSTDLDQPPPPVFHEYPTQQGNFPGDAYSTWSGTGGGSNPGAIAEADGTVRSLVGEAPAGVRVGAEFSLVVRISAEQPWPGARSALVENLLVGPAGQEVVLLVQPDFGLTGEDLQATVRVPFRGGSQPVRFGLRATRGGLRHLRISAWLGGTMLAELPMEVSAEERPGDNSVQTQRAPVGELRSDPGDVTMQVHFDGSRYSFQLVSTGYWSDPAVARSLTDAPGAAVERTVEMLRRLAAGRTAYGPGAARRWVRETGVGLWQDLVPEPIKDAFWELRDDIGSFTIACADDAVPWELLHPLGRGRDHGFLAEQFPVLRRVLGQHSAARISLADPHFVVPPGSPADAHAEADTLSRILPGPLLSRLDELLDLLDREDAGLLHFACHNAFSATQGGSSITLDGGAFVPLMLNSAVAQRSLDSRRPLVFVNACRSAGAAPEYTRMMGWADQFMRAGAGAFVGTLWPVSSARAAAYAEVFYAELTRGTALGQASLLARLAIEDESDPTWLAYTTYGDASSRAA